MVDELQADGDDLLSELEDGQPMSFGIFVLSLNASALIHLGESTELGASESPSSLPPSLPMARQIIDILTMLEQKTRGNLNGDEERLLHQILFDLRMRYSRRAGS